MKTHYTDDSPGRSFKIGIAITILVLAGVMFGAVLLLSPDQPPKYRTGDVVCLVLTGEKVQVINRFFDNYKPYEIRLQSGLSTKAYETELKVCQ